MRKELVFIAIAVSCLLPAYVAACAQSRTNGSLVETAISLDKYERSIQFDGLERTYHVDVPSSYDNGEPVPVVLAFHGRFGTGEAQAKLSGLDRVAKENGFITVYPDGIGRTWNADHGTGAAERRQIDDVGFVSALIDDLANDFRIDRRRVYATGMSNGAVFVHRLACQLSDKIAAIAPVAGTIPPEIAEECDPARPVSVIEIHGTEDKFMPWEGGLTGGGGRVESVWKTIEGWAARNQCSTTAEVTELGENVDRITFAPCQAGTEVVLYQIEGGGHTWPGGRQYLPKVLVGSTSGELNASEVIWDFFVRHPRAEP